MPNYTNLKDLFMATADAIRAKTGKTDSIVANNFPSEIAAISTSFPNGTEWSSGNLPSDVTLDLSGSIQITYANGRWVASSSTNGIFSSTNGIDWQHDVAEGSFGKAVYANGVWVIPSGPYASNGLYFSTDGVNWSQSNITQSNSFVITNANGLWVVGSSYGVYYSLDGVTWKPSNLENLSAYHSSIVNANGIWVIAGINNYGSYYSIDGMNWIESNATSYLMGTVAYANGMWVSASHNGGGIYYSKDGINWTRSNIDNRSVKKIVNYDGMWAAILYSGNIQFGIYYSMDGMNWVESNLTGVEITSITKVGTKWIACTKKKIYYGFNASDWHEATVNGLDPYLSNYGYEYFINANGIYIAPYSDGYCYSYDGMTWTCIKTNASMYNCNYNDGIWVAVGRSIEDVSFLYSIGWRPPT